MSFNKSQLLALANTADREALLYITAIHLDMIELLVNFVIHVYMNFGDKPELELEAVKVKERYEKLTRRFDLIPVTPKDKANDITKH
jgi:hypothetical protein